MKKKKILNIYLTWRKKNLNRKPDRVTVKIHWEDDPDTRLTDTIAFVPFNKIGFNENPKDGELILYYISSVNSLYDLSKPGNGSGFVIDEIVEFYKKDSRGIETIIEEAFKLREEYSSVVARLRAFISKHVPNKGIALPSEGIKEKWIQIPVRIPDNEGDYTDLMVLRKIFPDKIIAEDQFGNDVQTIPLADVLDDGLELIVGYIVPHIKNTK